MKVKLFIYIFVGVFTLWAMDGLNINNIFKKNRIGEARLIYFFIAVSIMYLVTNFFYDLYMCFN